LAFDRRQGTYTHFIEKLRFATSFFGGRGADFAATRDLQVVARGLAVSHNGLSQGRAAHSEDAGILALQVLGALLLAALVAKRPACSHFFA